jgi:hypothetical protein
MFEAGVPTFEDIAILPIFLSKVRIAIETNLDAPINHVAVVTFPLQPPQKLVFMDALLKAGINTTETQSGSDFVWISEAQAAYAALETTNERSRTALEQIDDTAHTTTPAHHPTPTQNMLFLSFDNSSFTASMHQLSPQSPQPRLLTYAARSDLGWWNLPIFPTPRATFWRKIHDCIVHASQDLGKPPGRIVLTGNHGGDVEFKQQVEAALWNEFEVDVGVLLEGNEAVDSTALAARGAAELKFIE